MVQELKRERQQGDFPQTAPAANPVFFRTYSRRTASGRETWEQVCDRTTQGFAKLGKLTPDETALLYRMMSQLKSLPSGRWLWVGGTDWIENPENFSRAYNCFFNLDYYIYIHIRESDNSVYRTCLAV